MRQFIYLCLAISSVTLSVATARARPTIADALREQLWPGASDSDMAPHAPGVLVCSTCHSSPTGGRGCAAPPCLNDFGDDVREVYVVQGRRDDFWTILAGRDSDGDGYSNALELGDIDGDGILTPDAMGFYPAPFSEPGVDRGDLDECALGMATCAEGLLCFDVRSTTRFDRPSYMCAAEPPAPPPPYHRYEPWRDAEPLVLDEWVEVDTIGARNPNVESDCGPSEASAWFRPVLDGSDCASGRVTVVREWSDGTDVGPTTIALVDEGSRWSDHHGEIRAFPTEQSCGPSEGGIDAEPADLLRVVGRFRGRLRMVCAPAPESCEPGMDACGARNPSCDTAAVVSEGTHAVMVEGGRGCVDGDRGGVHLAHQATCSGVLEVSASTSHSESFGFVPGVRVELRAGLCPEGRSLTCTDEPAAYRTRAEALARMPVMQGQDVSIRLSSDQRHPEDVTVRCLPLAAPLDALCAPGAYLWADPNAGQAECICDAFDRTGDGLRIDLGGTGCEPIDPGVAFCARLGVVCDENAHCLDFGGQPPRAGCACDDGYVGDGFTCWDLDECANQNECLNELHGACIDLEGAPPICTCDVGYHLVDERCVSECGDGERGIGEECDDGNGVEGDGCDSTCEVELNFDCNEHPNELSECWTTCGDGLLQPNEEPYDCTCGDGIFQPDEPPYDCLVLDPEACGCRTPGGTGSSRGGLLGLVGILALGLRRRLRATRRQG